MHQTVPVPKIYSHDSLFQVLGKEHVLINFPLLLLQIFHARVNIEQPDDIIALAVGSPHLLQQVLSAHLRLHVNRSVTGRVLKPHGLCLCRVKCEELEGEIQLLRESCQHGAQGEGRLDCHKFYRDRTCLKRVVKLKV